MLHAAPSALSANTTTNDNLGAQPYPASNSTDGVTQSSTPHANQLPHRTRIAFVGNSIQYFNDLPRLFEQLNSDVLQDSCLHGGTRYATLIQKGNGMQKKWATTPAKRSDGSFDIGAASVQELLLGADQETKVSWDYVVLNDYTQGPAREKVRTKSIAALRTAYAPLKMRFARFATVD